MHNDTREPAASPARDLFSLENRARLLEQAIGKPTGTVVEIGGVRFDLVPLSTRDGKWLVDSVQEMAAFSAALSTANASYDQLFALIGDKLPRAVEIVKSTLKTSAHVVTDEAASVFDEWFDATPFIRTMRVALVGILRGNGFGTLGDMLEKRFAALESGDPTTPATQTSDATPETPAPASD